MNAEGLEARVFIRGPAKNTAFGFDQFADILEPIGTEEDITLERPNSSAENHFGGKLRPRRGRGTLVFLRSGAFPLRHDQYTPGIRKSGLLLSSRRSTDFRAPEICESMPWPGISVAASSSSSPRKSSKKFGRGFGGSNTS